jgi:hypothetical protein
VVWYDGCFPPRLLCCAAKLGEASKEKQQLEELLRQLNDVLKKREEEMKGLRTKAKDKLALATYVWLPARLLACLLRAATCYLPRR